MRRVEISAFGRSKISTTFAATSATDSELDAVPYLGAGAGGGSVRRSGSVRTRGTTEHRMAKWRGKKEEGRGKEKGKEKENALSKNPGDHMEEQIGDNGLFKELDEVLHRILPRFPGRLVVVVAVRDEVHERVPVRVGKRRGGVGAEG